MIDRQKRLWIPEAPAIQLRRAREMAGNYSLGLEGHFTVRLIHARTGIIKQELSFKNLITNAGLNHIAGKGNSIVISFSHLGVGTGATEPAFTDINLVSPLGVRTIANGGFPDTTQNDGPEWTWWSRTINRVFTEAQVNGNLTELGFFTAASGGIMMNRQLFRDGLGNPTTIIKTDEDQLHVIFTWVMHVPVDDVVETDVLLSGPNTLHTLTHRPAAVGDAFGWGNMLTDLGRVQGVSGNGNFNIYRASSTDVLPDRTSIVQGEVPPTNVTTVPYVLGSFNMENQLEWAPSVANFSPPGIGLVEMMFTGINASSNQHRYKNFFTRFSPKIPKEDNQRFRYVARLHIGRGAP